MLYTGRLTEEDALVLVHARVREQQRRVVVGHYTGRGPVRVRVALEIFHEGAADLGLGPAFRRVGDALSQFHGLRLGFELRRHGCLALLGLQCAGDWSTGLRGAGVELLLACSRGSPLAAELLRERIARPQIDRLQLREAGPRTLGEKEASGRQTLF